MVNQYKWPTYVLALFLFLVGAVSLVMPRGYVIGFYGVVFLGIIAWLCKRDELLSKDTWLFTLPLLAYSVGHLFLGLMESFAWRSVDPVLPFVLVSFGVWVLRRYKPSPAWFWAGLACGAIGAAGISGYQAIKLGLRAEGFTHAIQFGNIALLFGVLCLVRAQTTWTLSWFNLLMLLGFGSGVASSVWSQTRGGWVAIALVFIWVLMQTIRPWFKRLISLLVLLGAIAIPMMQFGLYKIVESRVIEGVAETQAYFGSNMQNSSVGSRLAMWQFAIQRVGDAPLLGQGARGWIELRDQGIAKGELHPFIANFNHVHNEFLDVLLKRGAVGLVLLLMLYLGPMLCFFKPFLIFLDVEVKSLAMAGMVIPMMYMDFGLTQLFLGHNSGRVILTSLWMCIAALLLNAVEITGSSLSSKESH
jgi:O-antigen ligase